MTTRAILGATSCEAVQAHKMRHQEELQAEEAGRNTDALAYVVSASGLRDDESDGDKHGFSQKSVKKRRKPLNIALTTPRKTAGGSGSGSGGVSGVGVAIAARDPGARKDAGKKKGTFLIADVVLTILHAKWAPGRELKALEHKVEKNDWEDRRDSGS